MLATAANMRCMFHLQGLRMLMLSQHVEPSSCGHTEYAVQTDMHGPQVMYRLMCLLHSESFRTHSEHCHDTTDS